MKMIDNQRVVVEQDTRASYPSRVNAPFHPSEPYPEYAGDISSEYSNPIYAQVRQTLYHLDWMRTISVRQDGIQSVHWFRPARGF
jgi:hypothetical protein